LVIALIAGLAGWRAVTFSVAYAPANHRCCAVPDIEGTGQLLRILKVWLPVMYSNQGSRFDAFVGAP
jgi:hypothetical protein